MAARRDDDVSRIFTEHSVVLRFDDTCAHRRFLHVEKAEFFERGAHTAYTDTFVIGGKGRRKADVNGIARLDKHSHLFRFARYFFGVLRTYDEAMAAKDTFVPYNVRLVARKAYGFDRAMPYALIAVFTIRFL
jgi:hypothetical protein